MNTLKDFEYTMDSCNHCGQCKWILSPKAKGWDFAEICPIHQRYGFDAYSGQGLINIAKEILKGKLEYGDGLEELIYTCTCCGACDVNCKNVRDMEVLDTILALRADAARNGALPQELLNAAERIHKTKNLYGLPHKERFAWVPGDYEDDQDADTVLFIGCSAYRYPETARAAIKILRAGGVRFKLLYEEEWCCGAFLWRTGQTKEAAELVQRNVETFRKHGVKTIITTCAECFGAFRSGYPRFCETEFETRHISEVVYELLQNGRLSLQGKSGVKRLTYHDPCMLGRLSEPYVPWSGVIHPFGLHEPKKQWRCGEHGVYEPPREVLRAIPDVELVEMTRNYEDAYCCGAGAGAAAANPDFTAWAADERRREAIASGADAIVSSCPFCRDSFNSAGKHALMYIDFTELVADAL